MSNVTRITIDPSGEITSENGVQVDPLGGGVQDGSVLSVDTDGNVTQHGGVTRVQVSDQRPHNGTVLSTARSASGRSISGPDLLKPGATVETIPGNPASRTFISCAVDHGALEQDQMGNYREVAVRPDVLEAQQRATQQAADAQRAAAQAFEPSAEAAYQEALRTVHPGTFASAVNEMMEQGHASVATTHAIVEQTGKSREEVNAMLGQLMYAFDGKAIQAMAKGGLAASDVVDFDRWSRAHRADEYLEARLLMAHGRDASKLQQLAGEYLMHNPPSEAVLNAAGLKTFTKGGVLFVETSAGPYSVAAAARLKLI